VTDSTNGPNFSLYFLIFREPRKLYLELCTWHLYCKNLFYAKFRYPRKRGDSKNPLGSIYTVFRRICMLLIGSSVRKPSLFYVSLLLKLKTVLWIDLTRVLSIFLQSIPRQACLGRDSNPGRLTAGGHCTSTKELSRQLIAAYSEPLKYLFSSNLVFSNTPASDATSTTKAFSVYRRPVHYFWSCICTSKNLE
jgi:hypothetical protein